MKEMSFACKYTPILAVVAQADHIARVTTKVDRRSRRKQSRVQEPSTVGIRSEPLFALLVVTGGIPEQDAGGEVIHLVFGERWKRYQPARCASKFFPPFV